MKQKLTDTTKKWLASLRGIPKLASRALHHHLQKAHAKLYFSTFLNKLSAFFGKELYLVPDLKYWGCVGLTRWRGWCACLTASSF